VLPTIVSVIVNANDRFEPTLSLPAQEMIAVKQKTIVDSIYVYSTYGIVAESKDF
jgi:hypothetical protein